MSLDVTLAVVESTAQGVLDADARHALSRSAFLVFGPCLTFAALAKGVSAASLWAWWFLPVNMATSIGTSLAVGWLAVQASSPPPSCFRPLWAAAAFGNVVNLPLVLTAALCRSGAARRALLPAAAGAAECADVAAAYVMTPAAVASVLQFALGDAILTRRGGGSGGGARAQPPPPSPGDVGLVPLRVEDDPEGGGSELATSDGERRGAGGGTPSWLGAAAAGGDVLPAGTHVKDHAKPGPASAAYSELEALVPSLAPSPARPPARAPRWCAGGPWRAATAAASAAGLAAASNPPTTAALLGLALGVTPGGAGLLYGHAGHRAPLAVLGASVESLGHAMIPCLLLLLGAELAPGPGAARLPPRGVAAAVGARLLVLPMLGAAFVGALLAWGALSPPDPMFVVVCLLPWATPAAVVLQVIAGRTHDAATSAAVAALLFWHYAAAMLTLPLGGVVALHFLLPRGEAGG